MFPQLSCTPLAACHLVVPLLRDLCACHLVAPQLCAPCSLAVSVSSVARPLQFPMSVSSAQLPTPCSLHCVFKLRFPCSLPADVSSAQLPPLAACHLVSSQLRVLCSLAMRVSSAARPLQLPMRVFSAQLPAPCSLHYVFLLLRSLCSLPSVFCELPGPRSLVCVVSSAQLCAPCSLPCVFCQLSFPSLAAFLPVVLQLSAPLQLSIRLCSPFAPRPLIRALFRCARCLRCAFAFLPLPVPYPSACPLLLPRSFHPALPRGCVQFGQRVRACVLLSACGCSGFCCLFPVVLALLVFLPPIAVGLPSFPLPPVLLPAPVLGLRPP